MRKLKFRAWDILGKRYTYPDVGYQGHFVIDLNGRFHNLQNGSGGVEYVVQQFTGLKDKNGRDVYEGDIVSKTSKQPGAFSGEIAGEVFYSENRCAFMINDVYIASFLNVPANKEKHTVIGNIFENPDLIK